MVHVVRPAPDPRKWELVLYELSEKGDTEVLTYERTIDGVTESKEVVHDLVPYNLAAEREQRDRVLARRPRDEMIYDALRVHIAHAYN